MVELRVKVPQWAGEYIDEQVAAGQYSSPDALIVDLIDRARSKVASDHLAELIVEGETSGEGSRFTDEWWETRMSQLRAEAERRRSA
jgi:Arc/MetJ-type ribon-helix-helix transcriptional regulator